MQSDHICQVLTTPLHRRQEKNLLLRMHQRERKWQQRDRPLHSNRVISQILLVIICQFLSCNIMTSILHIQCLPHQVVLLTLLLFKLNYKVTLIWFVCLFCNIHYLLGPSQVLLKSNAIMKIPTQSSHDDNVSSNPLSRESNESSTTHREREALTVRLHNSILAAEPGMHVKFAAYKAAEFATLKNSMQHLDVFIAEVVDAKNEQVVLANQVWDPPEGESVEQLRLYLHAYDCFINEKTDFLVRALPDADPEYLEEMVRSSEGKFETKFCQTWLGIPPSEEEMISYTQISGDQEKIRNIVAQLLEGGEPYPTRADYEKRKEYNEVANKFFTVEEFLELYDDPFKHFGDETRIVDQVCMLSFFPL